MLSVVTMAASSSCRSAAPPGRGGGMVGRSGQGVAVETTALDDRRQCARLLEYADVLQRIAVDHQQVRIGARPQAAELALAANHLGAAQGGRAEDLQRRRARGRSEEARVGEEGGRK